MITSPSIWAAMKDNAENKVWEFSGIGPPVDGTTGAGFAGPGSNYVDVATGSAYSSSGTLLAPIWTSAGLRIAKATYDFSVDGGANGLITFARNTLIPLGAIVLGGVIDVITPGTGAGTMAIGTSAGSSAASVKAATAVASYTGLVATIPVFTVAGSFKMTASGYITGTIAGGPFTNGKWNISLTYMVS